MLLTARVIVPTSERAAPDCRLFVSDTISMSRVAIRAGGLCCVRFREFCVVVRGCVCESEHDMYACADIATACMCQSNNNSCALLASQSVSHAVSQPVSQSVSQPASQYVSQSVCQSESAGH